jgi:hypothetical protein
MIILNNRMGNPNNAGTFGKLPVLHGPKDNITQQGPMSNANYRISAKTFADR